MSSKAQLYKKILTVVSKMETIEKSGYNSHQKYAYSTEEDLVNAVRQLLLDQQLLILTSSETKELLKLNVPDKAAGGTKETIVSSVLTTHKFIDVETGEFETVTSSGLGHDALDKSTYKAITGSMKYFISKNFLVPGKDDAENDGITVPKTSTTTPTIKTPVIKADAGEAQVATVGNGAPGQVVAAKVVTPTVPAKKATPTTNAAATFKAPTVAGPATTLNPSAPVTPTFPKRKTVTTTKEPNFP